MRSINYDKLEAIKRTVAVAVKKFAQVLRHRSGGHGGNPSTRSLVWVMLDDLEALPGLDDKAKYRNYLALRQQVHQAVRAVVDAKYDIEIDAPASALTAALWPERMCEHCGSHFKDSGRYCSTACRDEAEELVASHATQGLDHDHSMDH